MPRGASATRRMELNRSRIDQVVAVIGRGLTEWGRQTAEQIARVAPDSPYEPWPLGEGLPRQGGVLTYFDGNKIDSAAGRAMPEPKVPRAAQIKRTRGLVMILGWGFPARFCEYGTARMRAKPFFTPTIEANLPKIPEVVGAYCKGKLGGPDNAL